MADDPAQRVGQAHAHLVLLLGLEHADDAVDGLAGIDRVERRHDQVTGLGGRQADLDRLTIAHFTHQNHLGRLAQRGPQAAGKRVEVHAQFPLIEGGLLLRMDVLDRVLKSDDVDRLAFVDLI